MHQKLSNGIVFVGDEEKALMKRSYLRSSVLGLLLVSGSDAQYPAMEALAKKVVQKYQQATCEQLLEKRGQPKSPQEQEAIQLLRNDPARRAAFLDKVAAPIANKMFECGMIP
jgi:hypothetical protein